jgi:FtsP/CotA-like multicopper oxidase with cupredoxin domain
MNNSHGAHGGVPPVIEPRDEGDDPFAGTAVVIPHSFANFGCDRLVTNPDTPEIVQPDVVLTRQMFPNGIITFHDGTTLRMFGFEEPDPNNPVDPELQLHFNRPWRPGPIVRLRQGQIFHGELKSRHGSHTIHWHGIEPTPFNDGVGHTSFEVTGHYTYQWRAAQAGTYFYHCHVNTPLHFEMGMYGMLIVDPPEGPGRAWENGPAYDVEAIWACDDVDPAYHLLDKEAGLCGGDFKMNVWNPRYFIVNGIQAIPGIAITDPSVSIRCGVNKTVLIRHLNASYSQQDVRILDPDGQPVEFQVIAVDGRPDTGPYAHPESVTDFYSITAQRSDILFTPTRVGKYTGVIEFRHWIGYEHVGTATIDISVGVTNPPSVVITSPGPAARVSGKVPVTAEASDDTGVAGVQFRVDGKAIGAEVRTAPYALTWDTLQVETGTHTLTAVARDRDGNLTESSPVPLFVFNTIGRPGVIASYGFNEGSGLTVHDSTGNGHHGTIGTARWALNAGRYGHALSFDGTAGCLVSIANSIGLELTAALTIEAWVKPTISSGPAQTIVAKDYGKSIAYGLYAWRGQGPASLVQVDCTDIVSVRQGGLPANTWAHVAMTYDGKVLRMYVNGVESAKRAVTGALEHSAGTLRIGGNGALGQYFKGLIDEVRIYNRALTALEVQQDMGAAI